MRFRFYLFHCKMFSIVTFSLLMFRGVSFSVFVSLQNEKKFLDLTTNQTQAQTSRLAQI